MKRRDTCRFTLRATCVCDYSAGDVELTRFRGHLRMLTGVHDGETKEVFSRVAGTGGATRSIRTNAGGAGARVRAIGAGDSELGQAGGARCGNSYGWPQD